MLGPKPEEWCTSTFTYFALLTFGCTGIDSNLLVAKCTPRIALRELKAATLTIKLQMAEDSRVQI